MKKLFFGLVVVVGLTVTWLSGQVTGPIYTVYPVGGGLNGGGTIVGSDGRTQISVVNFGLLTASHLTTRTSGDYTTAYTVNDALAVGNGGATNLPATFSSVLPLGSGKIIKLRVVTDSVTPVGTLRFWFYSGTNVTAQTDNAAYGIYYTNAATRLGYLDVTMVAGSACSYGMNIADQLPVNSTDGNLYYNIQTLSAFTPTAFTNVYAEVTVQPNK